jgi:hypothetical protein
MVKTSNACIFTTPTLFVIERAHVVLFSQGESRLLQQNMLPILTILSVPMT